MANEKRLIDANVLKDEILSWAVCINKPHLLSREDTMCVIDNAPTVDAVSRCAHDRARWERDVAIKQLEEHGIPFGGIAPDVVKVVRCKDCKHLYCCSAIDRMFYCRHPMGLKGMPNIVEENPFCQYGERKDND